MPISNFCEDCGWEHSEKVYGWKKKKCGRSSVLNFHSHSFPMLTKKKKKKKRENSKSNIFIKRKNGLEISWWI